MRWLVGNFAGTYATFEDICIQAISCILIFRLVAPVNEMDVTRKQLMRIQSPTTQRQLPENFPDTMRSYLLSVHLQVFNHIFPNGLGQRNITWQTLFHSFLNVIAAPRAMTAINNNCISVSVTYGTNYRNYQPSQVTNLILFRSSKRGNYSTIWKKGLQHFEKVTDSFF